MYRPVVDSGAGTVLLVLLQIATSSIDENVSYEYILLYILLYIDLVRRI